MSELTHGLGPTGVFLGTFLPKIDDKGRLILPAKFRDELRGGLVIAKGQERCLAIYTVEEFQRQAQAALSGPSTLKGIRDFQRSFAAGASQEVPDSLPYACIGRIVLIKRFGDG